MYECEFYTTDLAVEACGATHKQKDIEGVFYTESTTENGQALTVQTSDALLGSSEKELRLARTVSRLALTLLPDGFEASIAPVTVICLGNPSFTADSLGAICATDIAATRHLKTERPQIFSALGGREVSVICAGVTGNTGVNALEIAKMCVKDLGSKLIITVDSLKSASTEHLCRAIQLTNKITPGSGVGNDRPEISEMTVGVPVLSIGVPTAISLKSLVKQAVQSIEKTPSIAPVIGDFAKTPPSKEYFFNLRQSENSDKNQGENSGDKEDEIGFGESENSGNGQGEHGFGQEKNHDFKENGCGNLLVTPADCEVSLKRHARVIAQAINLTLLGTFL